MCCGIRARRADVLWFRHRARNLRTNFESRNFGTWVSLRVISVSHSSEMSTGHSDNFWSTGLTADRFSENDCIVFVHVLADRPGCHVEKRKTFRYPKRIVSDGPKIGRDRARMRENHIIVGLTA